MILGHDHPSAESPARAGGTAGVPRAPAQPLQRHLVGDAVGHDLVAANNLVVPLDVSAQPAHVIGIGFSEVIESLKLSK